MTHERISSFVPVLRRIGCYGEPQMSQPALLTLSRTASVLGGLLWAYLAPLFV